MTSGNSNSYSKLLFSKLFFFYLPANEGREGDCHFVYCLQKIVFAHLCFRVNLRFNLVFEKLILLNLVAKPTHRKQFVTVVLSASKVLLYQIRLHKLCINQGDFAGDR